MNTIPERNEAIVSAPGPIILGGRTFLVSAPTEADMYAVVKAATKAVRQRKAADVRSPLSRLIADIRDLPTEVQVEAIRAAQQLPTESVEPTQAEVAEEVQGLTGCRMLAWVLIRKKHPEVTFEQICSLITEDNSDVVFAEIDEASGMNRIKKAFRQAAG